MLDLTPCQKSSLPPLIMCCRLAGVLAAAAAAAAGLLAAALGLARLSLAAAAGLALRASCRLAGASWLPTSPPAGGARRGFLSSFPAEHSVSCHITETNTHTFHRKPSITQARDETFNTHGKDG